MNTVSKPRREDLEEYYQKEVGIKFRTKEEWYSNIVDTLVTFLSKNPYHYRCFGPYWWVIKDALNNAGHTQFGTTIDVEWLEKVSYDSKYDNMLAAFMYYEYAIENMFFATNEHTVIYDDGDSVQFILADEEIESFAMIQESR